VDGVDNNAICPLTRFRSIYDVCYVFAGANTSVSTTQDYAFDDANGNFVTAFNPTAAEKGDYSESNSWVDTSATNRYVQSVKLNGVALNHPYITYDQLKAGGNLDFTMGPVANDAWISGWDGKDPNSNLAP
jgi:putative alpha-1,2-mannosidase